MDAVFARPLPPVSPLRAAIRDSTRIEETQAVARILAAADLPEEVSGRIAGRARRLVAAVGSAKAGSMRFCTNTRCPRRRGWRSFASPRRCCASPMPKRSTG